jgi:hypothetical protein
MLEIQDFVHASTEGDFQGFFNVNEAGGNCLQIVGWAFANENFVSAIEVVAAGSTVATTTVGILRPDVAEAFPNTPAAGTSGFEFAIEANGKGSSHLEVQALLSDGDRRSLGHLTVVVGDHEPSRKLP